MLLRYVPLVVLVCLLTACGAEPRAEVGPRLFLAGDGELWVVDARAGKVRHLARSQLGLGDQPRRILARGNHLVMGAAYGDSAYFLRSAHRDRVWVVDVSARTALVSAVREVTVDGETTVAAVRPPGRQRPLAAVSDGLLFAAHGGVDVWDPATQRVVRHLRVNPSDLGPADRDVVTECAAACAVLRLIDVDTGAAREVRAPSGYRFEPWSAQFSSANRLLGIVVRGAGGDDAPRRLALVDTAKARAAVVPGSRVPPGYTLVAWSASSKYVFITGGDRFARRVIVGYRVGTPRAHPIDVEVGDFFDLAAI